jgi:predicted DNA-binding protein with PD1-like motif
MAREFIFRTPEGEEFVSWIEKFAEENGIRTAQVIAIGSLRNATLGYFNEGKGEYEKFEVEETRELVSALGNISLKNGKPMLHIHVSLGSRDGSLVGGHLFRGEVFVAEVYIKEVDTTLERERFGNLFLWKA